MSKLIENNSYNHLNPMWVTGFSDGESSFSVSIARNSLYKTGYKFIPAFAIELKDKDLDLLHKIQCFFKGAGKIHLIKNKGHAVYVVSSIYELDSIILPHFIKYPLLTKKRISFLLFKDIVNLMSKKSHLSLEGAQSIINIRASMNNGVTKNFLNNYPNTVPVVLPSVNSLGANDINAHWFAGFTDAEGCFFINVRFNRKKTGYWVTPAFTLVQHSRDISLFYLLKEFLGNQGFITEEGNKNVVRFRAEKLSFILEVLIPLFKNNLQSKKLEDYLSFCSVCYLIRDKAHLTEEGLIKIKKIKSNMNTGRV
uniref:LAGLIDADG endonuclease n=1 Tax=Phialocephala helvetica TaxID=242229 RepID=G8G1F6_9HELO|nr:LAGLIDADG endonuclease [Phialocephala helvetica]